MSRSIAGWSSPSSKLIHFTLPSIPSTPHAMELLRISVNGMFLTWFPPEFDNGLRIDYYEIDVRPMGEDDDDRGMEAEEYEEELKGREETAEERAKARAEHKKQVDIHTHKSIALTSMISPLLSLCTQPFFRIYN